MLFTGRPVRRAQADPKVPEDPEGCFELELSQALPARPHQDRQDLRTRRPGRSDDVAIVQAIVALAHRLRLEVVAEGWRRRNSAPSWRTADATRSRGTSSARRSRRNISPRWGDWSPNAREARRLRGSVAHRRRLYQINGLEPLGGEPSPT